LIESEHYDHILSPISNIASDHTEIENLTYSIADGIIFLLHIIIYYTMFEVEINSANHMVIYLVNFTIKLEK